MKPHVEPFFDSARIPTAMLSVTRLKVTAPLPTLCSMSDLSDARVFFATERTLLA